MKAKIQTVFTVVILLTLVLPVAVPASAAFPVLRSERRPVILIPGMTASANWSCFLFETSCQDPESWGWMPTADSYYANLIETLRQAGYDEDHNTFSILFYDWRKPVAEQAAWLKAEIDEIKSASGASRVDLIGHSMGGLVARAYIQSDLYGDDVANLVTLGSPHAGAAKSYPYWEAADFYQTEGFEELALNFLLWYYMLRQLNPIPVYVLREVFPGILDVMSTPTYLYDEENGDQPKPEEEMQHRNLYLHDLNADLDTLFARTQVSTFAGLELDTAERFYVHGRYFWEWPNWDDGVPDWDREAEFLSSAGDGTVLASSAELPPPANIQEFPAVSHNDLPNNPVVIRQVFDALGIPFPPQVAGKFVLQPGDREILALALHGSAAASLVGPSGETPAGIKIITAPDRSFTLILVPAPQAGEYRVTLQAAGSGEVALGLFDTAGNIPTPGLDVRQRWDVVRMDIPAGIRQEFSFKHAPGKSSPTLQAAPPLVELPAEPGSTDLTGRALPGQLVEVRDATTGLLLGKARAGADGRVSIHLRTPLRAGQSIVPISSGVTGNVLIVKVDRTSLPRLEQ